MSFHLIGFLLTCPVQIIMSLFCKFDEQALLNISPFLGDEHTLIIHDNSSDWFWGLAISDLIDGLDTELIWLVLRQVLQNQSAVLADITIGRVKLVWVVSHLLNIVATDWTASITARRLPGEGNGSLASVSVMQFLWGSGHTWKKEKQPWLLIPFYHLIISDNSVWKLLT